ncbi:MAG: branched-chain-amino-acid transaminase [Hungatella sp.]|nr:branched-chain-amino-acid transaminase [Hungatella sp.]
MKYSMEERMIWFKNGLVPIKDAKVLALSPTAQFGLNVFEGIPCYWSSKDHSMYAFRLNEHYERLQRSAKLLQISHSYTKEQMRKALEDVVCINEFDENISVRQTLFVDEFGSWGSDGPAEMFVVATPRSFNSSEYNQTGLKMCFSSWRRISDNTLSPRIKCGANYINSRVGQREAIRNGYDTCLFLNEFGKIAEGPGSCFFMIKKDTLITPNLTDSVLESITRDSVITIARDKGIRVVERMIDRSEVYTADEAFMCGSAMGITPVASIDGYEISFSEKSITNTIRDIYLKAAKNEEIQYSHWVTAVNRS